MEEEEEAEEESRGPWDVDTDPWKGSPLLRYHLRLPRPFRRVERRRRAANSKDSEIGRQAASEMPRALL